MSRGEPHPSLFKGVVDYRSNANEIFHQFEKELLPEVGAALDLSGDAPLGNDHS